MDPTCPLYGKEPLPLPKSMADLFPVRNSPSDDKKFFTSCHVRLKHNLLTLQEWEYEKET